MRQTREIITTLLSNIGSRKEVDQYLKQFSSVDSKRFAVVKVGGGIVTDHLEALTSALTFLHHVGLYPIVLHGAGPQLDIALKEAGIETSRIDGLRVTTPEVLDIARKVFQRENLKLVEALESLGTRARPITAGGFEAKPVEDERLGLVGEVVNIRLDAIDSSIRSGHLPILACLGETAGGQILNINADVAASELAMKLQPHKIIFLTPTGGLLDQHGRIIPAINLAEEYEHLMSESWLGGGMRLKLKEINDLLEQLPHTSSVSITSPEHLARELFTHRGSGTLVRAGERVRCFSSFGDADEPRLRALVEGCFQRRLDDNYFAKKQCYRLYLSDSYRATAILTLEDEIPYLDKFAVTKEAQGIGLGATLWMRMREDNPKMFWRSRTENPINSWYFEKAQGSYRTEQWTVFWYGLEGFAEVQHCIEMALEMPPSLIAHGSVEP